jgi:hypothetical protein
MCACGLEDVGSAPAAGATRYNGENWYGRAPPFEAPRGRALPGAAEDRTHATAAAPAPAAVNVMDFTGKVDAAADGRRGAEATEQTVAEGSEEQTERWLSMQYAFPRASLGEVVAALGSEHVRGSCAGKVVEFKFVGGPGRSLLGVNADGPVVCVNTLWRGDVVLEQRRLAELERALVALGGRPHLGKLHCRASAEAAQAQSAWRRSVQEFEECRRAADPEGRLGGALAC